MGENITMNRISWFLAALILLSAAVPMAAVAEENGEVNPFLDENLELYYEALELQGYVVPGAAYTADNEGDEQAYRYGPLQEGFVVDPSEATWRHENGSDFGLAGWFEDDNTYYLESRYDTSRLNLGAYYSESEWAKLEDLPDRIKNTWSDRQEWGLNVGSRKMIAGWDHYDVTRDPFYSSLNEYESDRGFVDFGIPVGFGDLNMSVVYSLLDSDQLMADEQATINSNLGWTYKPRRDTRIKLGLGTVQADSPLEGSDIQDHSQYLASLRIDRYRWPGDDWTVTLFGNYDTVDKSPVVNTRWDEWTNIGLKLKYDGLKGTSFEIGGKFESVDGERLDLANAPGLALIVNGTSRSDLDGYYISESPDVRQFWVKTRTKISDVGSWVNHARYSEYDDTHSTISSNPHYWPLYPETVFDYTTNFFLPVSNNAYLNFSDRFRWYESRTINSDISESADFNDNLASLSLTANPREDWNVTAYFDYITQNVDPSEIEGAAVDQFGLGLDLWHDFGNKLAFSGGLYYGESDEGYPGFEYLRVHGLVEYGPWGFYYEHVDADAEDYDNILVFDAFTAKVVYRIDL
jgi:hypothetical protein